MTLPAGQISFAEVNVELTRTSTAQLEVDDSSVRGIAAVGGAGTVISMNDLRGKSYVRLVISSNTSDYDIHTSATSSPSYSPVGTFIEVVVNPGVRVSTFSTSYAMFLPSNSPPSNNVKIINQGEIVGTGGQGGPNSIAGSGNPGSAGRDAIAIQRPISIDNQGTIAGGGGGGGAGGGYSLGRPIKQGGPVSYFGGSGGGGAGAYGTSPTAPGGLAGASPSPAYAGADGTPTSGGAGGSGTPILTQPLYTSYPGPGGAGGGLGSSGVAGTDGTSSGPAPQGTRTAGVGGAAGNYIVGNPFVTWINNGTRQGGVA
jgi:hypothetical protein